MISWLFNKWNLLNCFQRSLLWEKLKAIIFLGHFTKNFSIIIKIGRKFCFWLTHILMNWYDFVYIPFYIPTVLSWPEQKYVAIWWPQMALRHIFHRITTMGGTNPQSTLAIDSRSFVFLMKKQDWSEQDQSRIIKPSFNSKKYLTAHSLKQTINNLTALFKLQNAKTATNSKTKLSLPGSVCNCWYRAHTANIIRNH